MKITRIEVSGASLQGSQVLPGRGSGSGTLNVDEPLRLRASIDPGPLWAQDLLVEVYAGTIDGNGDFKNGTSQAMQPEQAETDSGGELHYSAVLSSAHSGQFGFTVRVMPIHPELAHKFSSHLITWAAAQ